MPDPRSIVFSREIIIGYKGNRRPDIYDEYGREPEHPSFKNEVQASQEWCTFLAFQGEFARLIGPRRRGLSYKFDRLDDLEDDPDDHRYHLGLETKRRPSSARSRGRAGKG